MFWQKTPSILVAAAALALSGAAVPATSAAAEPAGVMTVRFHDLNLSTPEGVAQLERRLERATRALCATDPVLASAAIEAERRACEQETLVAARQEIDAAVSAQRARRLAASTAGR